MLKWRHYGRKPLQSEPPILKTYYNFVDVDGTENKLFRKYVYTLLDSSSNKRVVIHYKGGDSVSSTTSPHIRTFPSVLRELEKSEGTPSILYKQKIGTCGPLQDHTSLMLPRNLQSM